MAFMFTPGQPMMLGQMPVVPQSQIMNPGHMGQPGLNVNVPPPPPQLQEGPSEEKLQEKGCLFKLDSNCFIFYIILIFLG